MRQGDFDGAPKLFEQCLVIARSVKHQELEATASATWAKSRCAPENLKAAQTRFARSLKVCRDAEDKRGEAIALWHLGSTDAAAGDLDAARAKLTEALRALQAFEMNAEVLDCLDDYAKVLQLAGQHETAVHALSAVEGSRDALGLRRSPQRDTEMQARMETARAALGQLAFGDAWATGKTWALDETIDRVLARADRGANRRGVAGPRSLTKKARRPEWWAALTN